MTKRKQAMGEIPPRSVGSPAAPAVSKPEQPVNPVG
jgi:hypothetical protein